MPGTPIDPGELYELDWEKADDRDRLPGRAPEGWGREVDPNRQNDPGGDGKWPVQIAHSPDEPARGGQWSARFELSKNDEAIGARGQSLGARAELSAADIPGAAEPFEPPGAERWYGFSIYLPNTWVADSNPEIVTQWHHDWRAPDQGSPPLAISTGKNRRDSNDADIYWFISMRDWRNNNTSSVKIAPCKADFNIWTDWVAHVKWSEQDEDRQAFVKIWKHGAEVFNWNKDTQKTRDAQPGQPATIGFQQTGGKNSYIDRNANPDKAYGNYIKIGIYKWCWNPSPSSSCNPPQPTDPATRIMYHDELRIADGRIYNSERDGYNAVSPPSIWIGSLYRDLLHRLYDKDGLKYWTAQQVAGTSAAAIARAFCASAEYCTLVATELYSWLLDRGPDDSGLAYWRAALIGGMRRQDAIINLLISQEYLSAHPVAPAFVESLYRRLLRREPDASGQQYWVAALDSGTTPGAVANAFLISEEFCLNYANSLYTQYLRRVPDEAGQRWWTDRLKEGLAHQDAIASFVSADEYQNSVRNWW